MKKLLNVGIVGVGTRGTLCFGNLLMKRDDCRIAAMMDINPVRLRLMAEKYGNPATYVDLNEMLEKESLDCVIITTPDAEHAACAITTMNHGVNVLIDKPLATSAKDCRAIIDAMHKSGKIAMMGFNLRHHPVLKKVKQLIDDGVLGKIFLMENREFYDGGRTYMSRWNGKKSYSGGLWNHKGSHDFDIFNWFLGFPKPVKVVAFSGMNVFRPELIPFELENGIRPGPRCCTCHYGKNGVCKAASEESGEEWGEEAVRLDHYVKDSCLYMSDLSTHDNGIAMVEYDNGVRVSHMECFVCGMTDRIYTIAGDKAIAQVSLHEKSIKVTDRWTKESTTYTLADSDGGHGGADPNLLDDFLSAVRGDRKNSSTLEQGMLSTSIAEAAELSREENRVVLL